MELRTIHTSRGTFLIDPERDKKMTQTLESGAYPNEELLSIARAFVGGKDTIVDIGAHIGTFAVPMAKVCKNVIAFEPSRETFALLLRNAQENSAEIRLVNKALGSVQGSGTLIVRSASNAGANTLMPGGDITVATLDEEVAHADFIKLDVEGMELDVLCGGTKLIERARPVIFFEVNLSQLRAHSTSPHALERFFTTHGYRLYLPLEQKKKIILARVQSMTLLTAFIAPRAFLFVSDSAPFDLIAVPRERALPLPRAGFAVAILHALKNNVSVKMHRLRAWFGYHSV